ncbi:hypothetical protein Ato02nite_040760 [Paractinoplanes toevensis]|uniref:Uncharacterized protein n=1 Tax=Paractinoplanes toevensis TaxID=571911 RepID=A0A919W631_9ACTN|nr:hypothetical protein Ato02nite_040760 [Actinoplanes toevensis]
MTPSIAFSSKYARSAAIVAVHCPVTGVATAGGAVSVGTLPVLWSYPQSSQKRDAPARGAPQWGHGGEAAAGAAAGGAAAGIDAVPPIFAPHSSQKSSVPDACPFGQV